MRSIKFRWLIWVGFIFKIVYYKDVSDLVRFYVFMKKRIIRLFFGR